MKIDIGVSRLNKVGASTMNEYLETFQIDVEDVKTKLGLTEEYTIVGWLSETVDSFEKSHKVDCEQLILGWELYLGFCLEMSVISDYEELVFVTEFRDIDVIVDPESDLRVTPVSSLEYSSIVLPRIDPESTNAILN